MILVIEPSGSYIYDVTEEEADLNFNVVKVNDETRYIGIGQFSPIIKERMCGWLFHTEKELKLVENIKVDSYYAYIEKGQYKKISQENAKALVKLASKNKK